MKLIDRFLAYVQQDTRSNPESETVPSTPTQLVFAQALADELRGIGLRDVQLDTNGYIMATLPANTSEAVPVIGFIAHMDTSPDMSGKDVRPQIIRNYPGGDIVLDSTNGVILSPENFPELLDYVGQDLICTDGTTLLGADDKAGIAEIVSAMEYLMEHPEIKHGTIRIGFTPDEEIGRGADHFDVAAFGADWAYTLDGGEIGELEFENFNAAGAKVVFKGRNVHPGYAKGKMINAAVLAMRFAGLMPEKETPEQTEGYEGFFHLTHFKGDVEQAELNYIVRDHDRARFEKRKGVLQRWTDLINDEYDSEVVQLFLTDQYYNMREKIEPEFMHVIDLAHRAMEAVGVQPKVKPIRGGTDGSRLSYMGLPCPNLFAGGLNFHGRFEFVPIPSMEKAMQVIVKIAALAVPKNTVE